MRSARPETHENHPFAPRYQGGVGEVADTRVGRQAPAGMVDAHVVDGDGTKPALVDSPLGSRFHAVRRHSRVGSDGLATGRTTQ